MVNFTLESPSFKVQFFSLVSKEIQKKIINIFTDSTYHILFVVGEGLRQKEGDNLTKKKKFYYLEYFFTIIIKIYFYFFLFVY